MDIKVEEVERKNGKAIRANIRAGNIVFRFCLRPSGKIAYTKGKPEARVYDPADCWVPHPVFKRIYVIAAGILNPQKHKAKGGT